MPIPAGTGTDRLYASEADLREQLGDDASRLSSNLLTRLLTTASRDVDRFTGRRFYLDTVPTTRTYDIPPAADDGRVLVHDIGSASGLLVGAGLDGVNFDTVTSDEYRLTPLDADQLDPDAFAWWWIEESPAVFNGEFGSWAWNRTLSITALWGWSAVPSAVTEATLLRAANLYKRKDAPFGVAGFDGFGSVRVRRDPDFVDLLKPYSRRVGIA